MSETEIKLQIGDIAPDFTTKVQNPDGSITDFDLHKFVKEGNKVLLVFYPGDDTPGCTAQLCGIRDIYKEYQDLGITVLGVNPAKAESHLKFIKKYNYQFGIIEDTQKTIKENLETEKTVREKYQAEKLFFKHKTTKRGVFLVNEKAEILFIHWGQQNNQEILDLVKNLDQD
jgi:peroxiredoxin